MDLWSSKPDLRPQPPPSIVISSEADGRNTITPGGTASARWGRSPERQKRCKTRAQGVRPPECATAKTTNDPVISTCGFRDTGGEHIRATVQSRPLSFRPERYIRSQPIGSAAKWRNLPAKSVHSNVTPSEDRVRLRWRPYGAGGSECFNLRPLQRQSATHFRARDTAGGLFHLRVG